MCRAAAYSPERKHSKSSDTLQRHRRTAFTQRGLPPVSPWHSCCSEISFHSARSLLLLQHNTFLLGHSKHRMQIVSQTYLEEISYFLMWTQEKTILTDVNGRWQKSDFLSKHTEGPSYGYGRGWRMTKQTNKNHHKIQNFSQKFATRDLLLNCSKGRREASSCLP